MKYFKILSTLLFCSTFFFFACNDKADSQKKETTKPFKQVPLNTTTNSQSSQNAQGIWHYYCNKGCAGGAGAVGNCSTCGGALTHNQAYHNNTTTQTNTPTNTPLKQSNTETGKNTAGVWHYTCAKGCSGGAGTASNCGTCGDKLAHNQAYHQ